MECIKKYIATFLFLSISCLITIKLSANTIDSLSSELKNKVGKERIGLLTDLSWQLKYQNPDLAIKYAEEGIELSRNEQVQQGKLLRYLAVYHSIKNEIDISNQYCNKAIKISETNQDAHEVAKCWVMLGLNYQKSAQYKAALRAYEDALVILSSVKDSMSIIKTVGNIANVNLAIENFPEAIKQYSRVIQYGESVNDLDLIAINKSNLARVYVKQANYYAALKHLFAALKIADARNNTYHIANCYNDIGIIFKKLELYGKAIKANKKALKLNEELGNDWRAAWSHNNIGGAYLYQKDYPLAQFHIQKSLDLSRKAGNNANQNALINLAICELETDKIKEANKTIHEAYQKSIANSNKSSEGLSLEVMGRIALLKKNWNAAEQLLLQAKVIFENLGMLRNVQSVSLFLGKVYEKQKKYKEAIQIQKLILAIEDSIFSENNRVQLQIAQLLVNNDFEKVNQESVANKETLENDNRTKNTNLYIFFLFGALSIIFCCYFIWKYWRQQKNLRITLDHLSESHSEIVELLKARNLELNYMALSAVQKSEFLEKQQLGIKLLAKSYPEDKKVRQLLHAYHFHHVAEKDWNQFKDIFSATYPTFLQNLQQIGLKFTHKELKHCMLVRLNISSEDAATLLGISPQSVHKSRYRLRKKLGVTTQITLENYLQNLPN